METTGLMAFLLKCKLGFRSPLGSTSLINIGVKAGLLQQHYQAILHSCSASMDHFDKRESEFQRIVSEFCVSNLKSQSWFALCIGQVYETSKS